MGIFNKKPKFVSSIPEKFHNLSMDKMTDSLILEINEQFPEIKTPAYIDVEQKKGHISENKAKELKKRYLLHSVEEAIKKEKEKFEKEQKSIFGKFKQPEQVKQTLVSVYESESIGIISREESDYLIDALK